MSNFDLSQYYNGLKIGYYTILMTLGLEIFSWSSVKKLIQSSRENQKLYRQAIVANVVNILGLGPGLYYLSKIYFVSPQPLLPYERIITLFNLLVIQSIGYYLAHRAMHTKPLYFSHKFHHQFNKIVIPMTANAVSIYEFFLAYMIPIIAGIYLCHPDDLTIQIATYIISMFNLIIHTPGLETISAKYYPKFLVSTANHLEHHRAQRTKYAAPLINWDHILN